MSIFYPAFVPLGSYLVWSIPASLLLPEPVVMRARGRTGLQLVSSLEQTELAGASLASPEPSWASILAEGPARALTTLIMRDAN